ncbi:MAG: DNA helicase UvrD [Haliscomenobacteraceae bacterium CHB4]|nr:RecBCD enzyme subunit RecB [Saprospiraceae bacterium]MCE7922395.1 DNA helicase UvrD [Haliscomenobacteraceae bacterium CHB4]
MQPTTVNRQPSTTLNIEVISAGAGSGKTYTLTGRMVELLQNGVRPAGIMATTFTKKAAAELQERVRVRLLEAGKTEAANELGEALIGTVHSIGTRLLQRFAFEAGVSPLVEIIADGDEQRLFNESLSQVLTEQRIERMNQLADRLGLTKKTMGAPYDWRRDIRNVTDVARANNFSNEVLKISKLRSWQSFERLLPPAQTTDNTTWHNRLLSALDQTVAALDANEADGTKTTRDAAEVLRNFQNQLKYRGELYWYEWVKIAKTSPGAKSRDLMEDLRALAFSHEEHRQFRDDVKGFIDLVFDIATDALDEYEQYKKKRGLIDYTDMETYVSRLLRVESVRETLRDELDLLLVDEFQDTSPIQLDIFLQISRLAKHSIWVGDPKQSIYGFRGAEPALMRAIIEATGGVCDENILKKSWRSRPDIVYATNAIFTRAFSDMPEEQVVLEPAWKADDAPPSTVYRLPSTALVHWHFRSELDEKKVPGAPWFDNCIADQIGVLLERKILIYNKKRTETRPVRPGDIAVLCRSNKGCYDMAEALHRAGLKASISRAGLLETPEAKLALACLKYLLTPTDSLSAAETILLTNSMNLEQLVDDRLEWLAFKAGNAPPPAGGSWSELPYLRELNTIRPHTADLSASEILNLVLDELDLRRLAVQLGNPNQRLDNLDRLRGYALDYESACQRLHSAASLGGFLLWINDLAKNELDYQGSGESDDAVKVLTYHRSKGLEYPVTICHNLNQPLKEQIWGINLVSEVEKPDLNDILGNRWIRFWVNPYGDQFRNTRLEETLLTTPEWAQASRTALEEEARLLYVGLTRARDYLIFPTNARGSGWLNRVFNHGDEDIPTLDSDSDETPFYRDGQPILCQTEVLYKPKDFPESLPDETPVPFHAARKGKHNVPRPSLLIDPLQDTGVVYHQSEPVVWASWLEFKGDYEPALGKAVQSFFIADNENLAPSERLAAAKKQLEIRGITEMVSPEGLARQSEAFRAFLEKQFKPKEKLGKFPWEGWHGQRVLKLEADFFLENDGSLAVVLFAPFAEGMKKWRQQVQALAPVLGWWRVLLRQVWSNKEAQFWIVFPIEGQAVELRF